MITREKINKRKTYTRQKKVLDHQQVFQIICLYTEQKKKRNNYIH